MPVDYKKYPPNWLTEIRPRILERAKLRCEHCGVCDHAIGYRNERGEFVPTYGNIVHDLAGRGLSYPSLEPISYREAKEMCDGINNIRDFYDSTQKYIVIVLTVAHLDFDETNHAVTDDRLAALCQKCHINYDIQNRRLRHRVKIYKNSLLPYR